MNEAYDTPFMRALLKEFPHALDDDGRQEQYRERSRTLYEGHDRELPALPVRDGLRCTGDGNETYD